MIVVTKFPLHNDLHALLTLDNGDFETTLNTKFIYVTASLFQNARNHNNTACNIDRPIGVQV